MFSLRVWPRYLSCKSTVSMELSLLTRQQVESAKATQATSITTPTDQVDISAEAELNNQTIEMIDQLQIQDLPEIRTDRVAQIREAIESGTYETEEKLNVAIDRLLDEIG